MTDSITRRPTRQINLGGVAVGGDAPISIQSMLSVKTSLVDACLAQIEDLQATGCQIIRFSVADMADADAIPELKRHARVPLVADIHFDHHLALAAIARGIDGLRLNPGNIASEEHVQSVVSAARERMLPIRIGVNSGSVPADLLREKGLCAETMVESALRHVRILERMNYHEIKISVKASHLPLMLASYRLLSQSTEYPLHLGITESGTMLRGSIKSAMALGILLQEGIGDTIRVSLTADPVQEVLVAKEILKALEMRHGLNVISCPTCGRTRMALIDLTAEVETALAPYSDLPITVAVMGCAVNGPGEAREADFGIAGGDGEGLLFARGKIVKKVAERDLVTELMALIRAEMSL